MNNRIFSMLWYLADFSGVGHLRSIFPNMLLNSRYAPQQKFSGLFSDRFFSDGRLLNDMNLIRFQRQITDPQVAYLRQLRSLKEQKQIRAGFIYDVDDLIIDIPEYNKCKVAYPVEMCRKNIREIFDLVDIFTTSTKYLSEKYQRELKGSQIVRTKFHVIPNLLPKFLYHMNPLYKTENEKPRVVWAGSGSHFDHEKNHLGDLALIYDLVLNTRDEFDWWFLGGLPPSFEKLDNINRIGWASCFDYPEVLRNINADFGLAPLLNNEFNISKSNIKYLEYSASQVVTIAQDLEPYHDDCKFFIQPTWQETRDLMIDIFQDKQKHQEALNEQNEAMKAYWMEDNLHHYLNPFGIKI